MYTGNGMAIMLKVESLWDKGSNRNLMLLATFLFKDNYDGNLHNEYQCC